VRQFDTFCFLDNNTRNNKSFDFLVAFQKKQELINPINPFVDFEDMVSKNNNWLFGYFSYDLKNNIEALSSNNSDYQLFPKIHFFIPSVIIKVKNNDVDILYESTYSICEINDVFDQINTILVHDQKIKPIKIKSRVNKQEYINKVLEIKRHLQSGDIYEMNYCQEFYVENLQIDPFNVFIKLNNVSKAPFTSFYRINNNFCLCASPERYLQKKNNKIISQPIKGTIKKSDNVLIDEKNKKALLNSAKDFSENVMIVDLVRNDLSRVAKQGTVKVEELAALYTYRDVHHLISTISCELDENKTISDIIRASFPMGSMTGAPKIRAMELIEKLEDTLRGLYSGSIGYIEPNKDFDFNVVIRSVFYNQQSQYLSFMVGGAITIDSDPELEYEECLLKAKSIFQVLSV